MPHVLLPSTDPVVAHRAITQRRRVTEAAARADRDQQLLEQMTDQVAEAFRSALKGRRV